VSKAGDDSWSIQYVSVGRSYCFGRPDMVVPSQIDTPDLWVVHAAATITITDRPGGEAALAEVANCTMTLE
jgi:hypothetical protein